MDYKIVELGKLSEQQQKGTFSFNNLTRVKQGRRNASIVYSGTKRMFTVDPNCEGHFELLAILKIKKIPIENKN